MKSCTEVHMMINAVAKTADYLDKDAYLAICDFIRQSQCKSGAFIDRGGNPDWYYSLFGYILCKAYNMQPQLAQLKKYVLSKRTWNNNNLVDSIAWAILRYTFSKSLNFKLFITSRLIVLWLSQKRKLIDQSYLAFMTLLLYNHFWGKNRWLARLINRLAAKTVIHEHTPSAHLAALMIIQKHGNLDTSEISNLLICYAHPEGGFSSFQDNKQPDMLSTAVAAYALNHAGHDFSFMTSNSLNYITENYTNGSFLSGDGDEKSDLEYTFYGLLALSSFIQSLNADPT